MKIVCEKDFDNLQDGNKLVGNKPILKQSCINFNGRNNILVCDEKVCLEHSNLTFKGDNSLIFLCRSRHVYKLNVSIFHNSVFFIGCDNYFNGVLNVVLSEQKHVYIGDNGLFSFGIWIRIADPHLIYDIETKCRKNTTRSVFIGDHVWIGQSAMILKGTQISSGSIVGAMSVVAGKRIYSNESWAGNPARLVAKSIFWEGECVHSWRTEETTRNFVNIQINHIYEYSDPEYISFDGIDIELSALATSFEKYEYLKKLNELKAKNRFALFETKKRKYFSFPVLK